MIKDGVSSLFGWFCFGSDAVLSYLNLVSQIKMCVKSVCLCIFVVDVVHNRKGKSWVDLDNSSHLPQSSLFANDNTPLVP